MEADLKRILIISNPSLSDIGNNGKTFLSLFKDFEDNQVSQLYFNNELPNQGKFKDFFRVTDRDMIIYLLSFRSIKKFGKISSYSNTNVTSPTRIEKFVIGNSFLKKLIRNFFYNFFPYSLFSIWLKKIKPTSIFFVGSNYIYSYRILEFISKKFEIPYYVYFTDDYFKYNFGNSFISRFFHKRFINKTKHIIEGAKELFVISPKMKYEYQDFFNKECSILVNAVKREIVPSKTKNFEKRVLFRYFGWLHSNRASSIRYLAQCLKFINANFGLDCILEVYTLSEVTGKIKDDLNLETIKVCEPVSGNILTEKINSSDFLVHAESFEKIDIQITKLSISTKIPEYLVSNRCIIAIGPPDLASISIFKNDALGIVLSEKITIEKDACEIFKVISDLDIYNEYCKRAEEYYDLTFNAIKMKALLKEKLLSF